jgi:aminoglycoside/choline kinase family phosphotransferase
VSLDEELRALAARALGAPVQAIEPLHGGLAHRRFFRLRLAGGASCVARVDRGEPAPGVLPEPPLEPTRAFLEAHGLPVPRRLGGDEAAGIDLLEDAGSRPLAAVAPAADAALRRALYEEACDLVPRLQRLSDPGGVPGFGRRLDAALLALKARRFLGASVPAALGRPAGDAEREVVEGAFAAVREAVEAAPLRFAHRDLQGANLLVDESRPPGARLVMIDLQGAFLAPPEYDLVCLLRDSYVVLADEELRALAERVRPALPDAPPRDVFARRFDLLTIARKAKDHALFHEVAARGDPSWLRFAPATLGYLRAAAARLAGSDARLAAFAALLDAFGPGGAACAR